MGMRVVHLLSLYHLFGVLRLLCAVVRMLKCSYLLAISFSGNILMLSIVGVKTLYGVQRTSKVGCDLFICLLVFYFGAERKSLGILK